MTGGYSPWVKFNAHPWVFLNAQRQIAAHALSAGAMLVTNNCRHYERIEAPLMVDNWT